MLAGRVGSNIHLGYPFLRFAGQVNCRPFGRNPEQTDWTPDGVSVDPLPALSGARIIMGRDRGIPDLSEKNRDDACASIKHTGRGP